MSTYIPLLIILVFTATANANTVRLSEPVASDLLTETFGSLIDDTQPSRTLSEVLDEAERIEGQNLLIETRIGKVCQKKGCFFLATEGTLSVRVSFKDYGFFVPTNSSGKEVLLSGQLVQRDLSQEEAAHFNSDIQDGGATLSAGPVYEIVADAVRVPR